MISLYSQFVFIQCARTDVKEITFLDVQASLVNEKCPGIDCKGHQKVYVLHFIQMLHKLFAQLSKSKSFFRAKTYLQFLFYVM
jgi:hypothetical protein